MPDRLRRNGAEQETRLVIAVLITCVIRPGVAEAGDGCMVDLRRNAAPHIVAMYQLDTSV